MHSKNKPPMGNRNVNLLHPSPPMSSLFMQNNKSFLVILANQKKHLLNQKTNGFSLVVEDCNILQDLRRANSYSYCLIVWLGPQ